MQQSNNNQSKRDTKNGLTSLASRRHEAQVLRSSTRNKTNPNIPRPAECDSDRQLYSNNTSKDCHMKDEVEAVVTSHCKSGRGSKLSLSNQQQARADETALDSADQFKQRGMVSSGGGAIFPYLQPNCKVGENSSGVQSRKSQAVQVLHQEGGEEMYEKGHKCMIKWREDTPVPGVNLQFGKILKFTKKDCDSCIKHPIDRSDEQPVVPMTPIHSPSV
jgi:hypothetical protein